MAKIFCSIVFVLLLCLPEAAFAWRKQTETDDFRSKSKISLIFSSENIRSPISSFGHTFIVFHNEIPPEASAVALEFVGDSTQPTFTHLKAGFGTVKGKYQLQPFWLKMREYNSQDRDLWVFPFADPQTAKTYFKKQMPHILQQSAPYNFFTRNCSYYITQLVVEALYGEHYRAWPITIPAYTVKYLNRRNALLPPQYIPAPQKTLLASYAGLNNQQRQQVKELVQTGEAPASTLDPTFAANIINYRTTREASSYVRDRLYASKKSYPNGSPPAAQDAAFYPSGAYLSTQATDKGEAVLEFSLAQRGRKNFYDEPVTTGYLQMGTASLVTDNDDLQIRDFSVLKMLSRLPHTPLNTGFTRYLDLSYYNWEYLTQKHQSEIVARYGAGVSAPFGRNGVGAIIPFVGVKHYDGPTNNKILGEAGVRSSLTFKVEPLRTLVDLNYFWVALGNKAFEHKYSAELVRPITRNVSAYGHYEGTPHHNFWSLGLVYKF